MSLLVLAAVALQGAPATGGLIPPAASRIAEAFGWLAGVLMAAGLVTGTTRQAIRWVVLWACNADVRERNAQHAALAAKLELMERTADGNQREVTRELGIVAEKLGECVEQLRMIATEQRQHGEDIASLLTAANIRRRSADARDRT